MAEKTFTLRDVANALINDPTPKATGTFFAKTKNGTYNDEVNIRSAAAGVYVDHWGNEHPDEEIVIGSTCAIGGAALALGLQPDALQTALNEIACRMGYKPARLRELGLEYSRVVDEKTNNPFLGELIVTVNDNARISKKALGERILKHCAEFLDVQMTAEEVQYHADVAGRTA